MAKMNVLNQAVTVKRLQDHDYISLTDIARFKDAQRTDYLILNWMRNRNTIEFLGIWEQLNNPGFNPIEFDGIKSRSGLNSFILTVKAWVVYAWDPFSSPLFLSPPDRFSRSRKYNAPGPAQSHPGTTIAQAQGQYMLVTLFSS